MNEQDLAVRRRRSRRWHCRDAGARAKQRNRHRHHHHDHRPGRGARHSRAQLARIRAKEIGGVPLKVIVLDDGGDPTDGHHQCPPLRHGIQGRHHHGLVDHAADDRGLQRRQRGRTFRISAWRRSRSRRSAPSGRWSMPQPIPIMGKVMYEHMKKNNVKTVGYIGYSDSYGDLWFNDFKNQGVPMGMTIADRGALRAAGYLGRRPGAETRRRQSRRDPGRRLRHRRGAAADHAARTRLQGPDLPDPRRRQHGLHPHRGKLRRKA